MLTKLKTVVEIEPKNGNKSVFLSTLVFSSSATYTVNNILTATISDISL